VLRKAIQHEVWDEQGNERKELDENTIRSPGMVAGNGRLSAGSRLSRLSSTGEIVPVYASLLLGFQTAAAPGTRTRLLVAPVLRAYARNDWKRLYQPLRINY